MTELVEKLEKAREAYYNSGEPILSDEEYDNLVEKLRKSDPDNAFFKTVGAPVSGAKVQHDIPMGSQEKLKDKNKFLEWCKTLDGGLIIVQLKLDGCSVAINYVDSKLVSAVSRGDGIVGKNITTNVLRMNNVKKAIPGFTGSVRGEMIMKIKTHDDVFIPLDYENPRNTVSGLAMDQKDSGNLQKHVDVIFYDIFCDEDFDTELDRIEYLKKKLGLVTVETHAYTSPEKAWEAFQKLQEARAKLEYECDGIVVRANSIECQKQLGTSSDLCPKGQKCVKFEAEGAVTDIEDVTHDVGHTGMITPCVVLKPVRIGGVTVSSATLSNFKLIKKLDIAIGDQVRATRRGGVIPKVEHRVAEGANRRPIVVPTECPSCGSKLVESGANIFCRNEECKGRILRRLMAYAEKRNIKWLGEEVLAELFKNHGVKTPADIYKISEEQLSKVKRGLGVVGSGAKQIIEEIEKSRESSLNDFIGSLGIEFLGRRQAEIMMGQGIDTLDKFLSATVSDLTKLTGFSEEGTKAPGIVEGIRKAKPIIEELAKCVKIVEPKPKPKPVEGGKLAGKSFCFTGAIEKMDSAGKRYTRKRMQELVMQLGGRSDEDVAAGLTYLVQADPSSTSSKTKKAGKLGVTILSEADFWKMVEA